MVDVSQKEITLREAEAACRVSLSREAFDAVRANRLAKGDVLGVARIAGITAAKRTSDWIPLCHQIPLDEVRIDIEPDDAALTLEIRAVARARAVTGVEMEALVAAGAAALALYDMVKAVDRGALIGPLGLVRKQGGKRGEYRRSWPPAPDTPEGG